MNENEIEKAIEELKVALLENLETKKQEEEAKIANQKSHYKKQKALELLMSLMRD